MYPPPMVPCARPTTPQCHLASTWSVMLCGAHWYHLVDKPAEVEFSILELDGSEQTLTQRRRKKQIDYFQASRYSLT